MPVPTPSPRPPLAAKPPRRLLRPVPLAVALACAGSAQAQTAAAAPSAAASAAAPAAPEAESAPALRLDRELSPLPRGAGSQALPAFVRAERVEIQPGERALAEGAVEFRRGGTVLRADRVEYGYRDDTLRAQGQVVISRDGVQYRGPALQVQLETFKGWFEQPSFDLAAQGAGGDAQRVEFLDASRIRALQARYTSCPRDDAVGPAWQLSTQRLDLDLAKNEGIAQGAVLRFLGVPILAAPTLSFPISDERKSGWLPPNVNLDSRSGIDISVPYYWNIAPHRDATITPRILTRRGVGADLEFRYLEPRYAGSVGLDWLPNDRVAGRSRYALRAEQLGHLGERLGWLRGAALSWRGVRVSDDDWWKDFPRSTSSITPRLLAQTAALEQALAWGVASGSWYARLAHWQTLQSAEAIVAPYQRSPQIGLQLQAPLPAGLQTQFETELNRFTLSRPSAADAGRPAGLRWHAHAALSRPWRRPGWWLTPALTLQAAVYDTQGRGSASRFLPTLSVDAGASFERQVRFLGRDLRQVLAPRIHYVRTPFRDQRQLPNYDSAGKDFNFTSIYSDNAWSGVDRISDSHQLTLGATTRLVRDADGAEVLRLGLVQRMLIDPERVTPDDANPALESAIPLARRLSDMLFVGTTQVVPRWTLEGALRFNADTQRAVRSVLSARYSAGDFRTLSAAYRFTRGQAEQIDFGWQWPVTQAGPAAAPGTGSSRGGACSGRLFSVGRVNYSMVDRRITDSLLGLEYDAGCWIGRLVAERVSTGRSEATTRLMLQLELVGLSRLGSNPLGVLKDNIPGYRLLREERGERPTTNSLYD
jgi:LPS-assembly protein